MINVTKPTAKIIIHSVELNIHENLTKVEEFAGENTHGKEIKIAGHKYYNDSREYMIINLNDILEANRQYKLHLTFDGELNKDLKGFYLSSYKEGSTTK